jgi:hypothetical protein
MDGTPQHAARPTVRLPEELESLPPGVELASLLSSVDRSALSERDRVRLARARNRLLSHVNAELLADLHAVTWEEPPDEDAMVHGGLASRYPWAECEVAFALTWTHTAAGARLEQARQLVEELPQVLAALRAGDIDMPKVLVIADLAGWLDDRAAAQVVVDRVLVKAPEWTTGQLRARLRKLILAVDPEAARKRCATAVGTRRVEVIGNPDGSGDVWGRSLPPQDVAAAWERLTAIARSARSAGDRRPMDQLRADAFLDLLVGQGVATGGPVGRHTGGLPDAERPPAADVPPVAVGSGTAAASGGAMPGPRRGVVELQVPLTALMGLTNLPGELTGFGPVVADIARQVAEQHRDGTWRFSVYSEIGDLISHGITRARPDPPARTRRRRPTAEMAAVVRARNRTCVAPGCRVPASLCDLDHAVDWARGGATDESNLDPKCRLHHRFKHESGAKVATLAPGVVAWQTPRGLQYVSAPDPPLLDDELINLGSYAAGGG